MPRGRKAAPTALKVLKGTQKCRLNPAEPAPEVGRPELPGHLDAVAAAEWERVVPRLEASGVLTRADGPALAIYCAAYSRWIAARQLIEQMGLVIDTTDKPKGCIKANPAVAIAEAAEATMARVLGSFGLTPADRSRVRAARPESAESPLAKFQIKKG